MKLLLCLVLPLVVTTCSVEYQDPENPALRAGVHHTFDGKTLKRLRR